MFQGATYLFDYTFKAGVTYAVKFDATLSADGDKLRFYLHNGTSDSAAEIKRHDNVAVNEGGNAISFEFTPTADTSGKAFFKFHSGASLTEYPDIRIDNFIITNDGGLPTYECKFDLAEDSTGWEAYTNASYAGTSALPTVKTVGFSNYVAGNGYVHVSNRASAVSGAAYTSTTTLTGGQTYTLKIKMRASNADEYIRAFAYGKQFALTTLPDTWTELTATITPAADGPLSLYIHNGSDAPARYVHGFTDFDIDSLVVTDSTGNPVINETYDDNKGAWVSHTDTGRYTPKQSATITHEIENDYATAPGSVATYTPADEMSLKAGTYVISGTFKVPYNRANLAVARALKMDGDAIASYLAPTVVIADYNKINVGVMIVDTEGNSYYAEENSVPVATSWTNINFGVEIPNDIVVDYISFMGKDGVMPVAGEYPLGSETVKVGLLKDDFDATITDDDALENSPMLVDVLNGGVSQIYDHVNGNYSTIEGADGFLADAVIPFQFRDAEITMTKLKPVETTDASPVGILAMLLLRRAMNNNNDENVDGDEVIENTETERYLRVETTEYPQGVEFVTIDSAYVLDANKEYTLEIKMRTAAAGISYYRAYCAGGAPSTFSGDYEVKPESWINSGFSVEGADWVVVSGNIKAGVSGQLGIKLHGGSVGGVTYGDSFEIDYVKVTEKGTDNVFFYEDFEDDEINCTCNAINGAVGAAVKGA